MLAATMVTACVPSEPYSPVAVLADGSQVQVRLTNCPPSPVNQVRIIPLRLRKDKLLDTNVPAVWQVSFAQPTVITAVVVGTEAPSGGTLDIALAGPLDPATEYVVFLRYPNGGKPYAVFKPEELHDGRVQFETTYLSREEFDRRSACKAK
ncbi:hypothetical protein [Dactylosporangium sp. NPDC051484]|uniref:hypothetical protein n=1 Tax=Dactylosporangium sp. NPDC051484 TaxID=3154942 RepID=UPI00344FC406